MSLGNEYLSKKKIRFRTNSNNYDRLEDINNTETNGKLLKKSSYVYFLFKNSLLIVYFNLFQMYLNLRYFNF